MGLPMWRAPSPSEAKDAVKSDPSAAARSPIRRRRSPALRRTASIRRSDGLYGTISEPIYRRSSPSVNVEPPRDDASSRPVDANNTEPSADAPAPSASFPSLPDFVSLASRGDPTRDNDDTVVIIPQTWRERRLRLRRSSTHDLMEFLAEDEPRLPSYTPNFAPARLSSAAPNPAEPLREWSSADFGSYGVRHASPHSYSNQPAMQRAMLHRSSENSSASSSTDERERRSTPVAFPPLRRRRAIADGPLPSSSLRESWSPASTIDGLGDRERSVSPAHEWETMLNTIQPDNNLPSAGSSFASAAASRSFSNSNASSRSSSSNSASSSRTHLTVPSLEIVDLCNDSGSDTEPEEGPDGSAARAHDSDESTLFVPEGVPPTRNPRRYSRNVRRRSQEASRFVRNYYSFTERAGPREENATNSAQRSREGSARASFSGNDGTPSTDAHAQDPDLEQMRSILEHLARRNDIPDEFWISAGLTRTMAQSVDRAEGLLRARAERMERRRALLERL